MYARLAATVAAGQLRLLLARSVVKRFPIAEF